MKKYVIITWLSFLLTTLLRHGIVYGQTTFDYFLLPCDTFSLPEGSSQQLSIWWADSTGGLHEGISDMSITAPRWYINGKEYSNANPKEGKLSVTLALEHPTYTAPAAIPPQNPVTISVNFKTNYTSKEFTTLLCKIRVIAPKNKWYVSYTCSSYKYSSTKSRSENSVYESHANGSASMVVDAPPPDESGYVHFSAPGDDKLENASVSGSMTEKSSNISRDINGAIIEKTIRNHKGQVDPQFEGIEFEYDPESPGDIGLNSGILFNMHDIDKFWKWDDNSHSIKLVDTYNHSQKDETNISVGASGQTVMKTKTGFTINYNEAKDTSYADVLGVRHTERSGLRYDVTISYVKGNSHSPGKKEE